MSTSILISHAPRYLTGHHFYHDNLNVMAQNYSSVRICSDWPDRDDHVSVVIHVRPQTSPLELICIEIERENERHLLKGIVMHKPEYKYVRAEHYLH